MKLRTLLLRPAAFLSALCLLLTGSVAALPVSAVETQSADYDFEFKTAASVDGFTAKAGSVSYQSGRLVYTLSGANTRLTSPVITAAAGTAYSAKMPLRNTIFVRLKNATAAESVRVYYTTTGATSYDEKKSAEFAVEPHSNFTSYFFNLSECASVASGYISGFAIEPIGATSGTMEIEAITFEREAAKYDYAGTVDSCTTDGETVTVTGTLKDAYAGMTVSLYETLIGNYAEDLKEHEIVASTKANGTNFTLTVPYMKGTMTRLSSIFLAGVDGVKIAQRFVIENYQDHTENPYAFTLPDYEVKVTDSRFGAKGDAFTNDTAAIQAAIDHVSAQGGGRVVIPGDDSRYGRRYVATCIRLKSNVDLHIEEGAIIWQSPRTEDYDYDVLPGHDMENTDIPWAHTASCHNYPLIYGNGVDHVKITGKGLIRSVDTGSENGDSVSAANIWIGCENRLHVVPIGLFDCTDVEVSGVGLRRTNNYHVNFRTCRRIYIADVMMIEGTCGSGDGISATVGTKDITIDRCYFYSNDDAVTLCSTYNDPRGIAWWHPNPDGDNCVENVNIVHSNLNGGRGVTFITWGTDNPDVSRQEIKNVTVTDNVLSGSCSVGAWYDNPFYGGSSNTETNDYSPVKGVRILNNQYRSKLDLGAIQATDLVADFGLHSASDFEYGNFERGNSEEPTWVAGLSNWSILDTPTANVSVGSNTSTGNHYGVIRQSGTLAQGLYMTKGPHTFRVDTEFTAGEATLVVVDILTGELLAQRTATQSATLTNQSLTFNMKEGRNVYIGVQYKGTGEIAIDNASVSTRTFEPDQYFTETFEDADAMQLRNDGFELTTTDGIPAAVIPDGRSGMMMLKSNFDYKEFDLHMLLRFDGAADGALSDANFALSFLRVDSNTQYDLNYTPLRRYMEARSFKNGAETRIQRKTAYSLPTGEWIDFAVRVMSGQCQVYVDGEMVMEFAVEDRAAASFCIAAYNVNCAIADVELAEAGTTQIDRITEQKPIPETEPETEPVTEPETLPESESDTSSENEPVTTPSTETDPEIDSTTRPTEGDAGDPPAAAETGKDNENDLPDDIEDDGCASSAIGAASLLSLAGAAIVLSKKKREK